jgi:hypothetical protein
MKFKTFVALSIATFGLAATLEAQGDDQYTFGVSGGLAVPTRQLGDVTKPGANGTISVTMGNIGSTFGVRFDGMYNWLPEKDDPPDSIAPTGDVRILALTGNLVFSLIGIDTRLYSILGIGAYAYRPHASGAEKANDFGWNAGLGVWIPALDGFIEARFHNFYRALPDPVTGAKGKKSAQFVPVTIGFLW